MKANFTRVLGAISASKQAKQARFLPNPEPNWGPRPKHGRPVRVSHSRSLCSWLGRRYSTWSATNGHLAHFCLPQHPTSSVSRQLADVASMFAGTRAGKQPCRRLCSPIVKWRCITCITCRACRPGRVSRAASAGRQHPCAAPSTLGAASTSDGSRPAAAISQRQGRGGKRRAVRCRRGDGLGSSWVLCCCPPKGCACRDCRPCTARRELGASW